MEAKPAKTAMPTATPKLRFPKFRKAGAWEVKKLGEISKIVRGGSPRPIENFLTMEENGLNWLSIGDLEQKAKYVTNTLRKVRADALEKTRVVNSDDLILSNSMSFGRPYILKIKACIHDGWIAITKIPESYSINYLYYLISSEVSQSYFLRNAAGSGVLNLNAEIIKLLPAPLPQLSEQQKIADCLSSVDELLTAQTHKIAALQEHKKGLMQQLFPLAGKTLPTLRFPKFRKAGAWEVKKLDFFLDYQQPAEYVVSDTKYRDVYKTPVLTAGKTFILGYTNERHKIFRENLPVIIFDDFTTATQFVDFPFKVKSTAMKILHAKSSANIKFMYELMQMITYELGGHSRHWISKFAQMKVLAPPFSEQQKIADCLSSVDETITAQTQKIAALQEHKKGLMQQLFPSPMEVMQ